MSEHLEAAIESLRQADLAIEEADRKTEAGYTDDALSAVGDSMGHVRIAVNHLAGAVQELVAWRETVIYRTALSHTDPEEVDLIG